MRCVLPRSRIKNDHSPRQTPDVGTGSSDSGHHVVAGLEILHVGPGLQHAPEGLVASYQDVAALRGSPCSAWLISLSVPSTPARSSTSTRTPRPSGTSSIPVPADRPDLSRRPQPGHLSLGLANGTPVRLPRPVGT